MTKLKNFLRCYAMGMGIKSIANTFQTSRNTVRKYVRRYQESGLSLEQLQSMSEDKLQDMFLDNKTPADIEAALGVKTEFYPNDGYRLAQKLLGTEF